MAVNNNSVNIVNGLSRNINMLHGAQTAQTAPRPTQFNVDFDRILQEKVNDQAGVKFSKHAESRLQSRNILLTQSQKNKISEAVKKAEEKGVKDSLVIMDNLAFVVNVKSKTVITAVNSSELKENVFTNIDGAVLV